jgi:hypothetical protein
MRPVTTFRDSAPADTGRQDEWPQQICEHHGADKPGGGISNEHVRFVKKIGVYTCFLHIHLLILKS